MRVVIIHKDFRSNIFLNCLMVEAQKRKINYKNITVVGPLVLTVTPFNYGSYYDGVFLYNDLYDEEK